MAKFKAQCLAVLQEVEAKREPVLLTKRGKPLAKVMPPDLAVGEDPLARYLFPGKLQIVGDIMAPPYTDEEYEALYEAKARKFNDPA